MNSFIWQGRSRTHFVREAEVRVAEKILMETAPIRMSPTGSRPLLKSFRNPRALYLKWSSSFNAPLRGSPET